MERAELEQLIAGVKARHVDLEVKIHSSRPLMPDEKKALAEDRAAAVAIILDMPRDVEEAEQRGYAAGVRHAVEKFNQTKPEPAPTTSDLEMQKFEKWTREKSEYWWWEPECLAALRAEIEGAPGSRIQPMFAYSCVIVRPDGREETFQRRPTRTRKSK